MKETKELTLAFLEIAKLLALQFKDGVQKDDALEIIKGAMTPELQRCIVDAYNGIEHVPSELKEMDLNDIIEIIKICSPKLIELYKEIGRKT